MLTRAAEPFSDQHEAEEAEEHRLGMMDANYELRFNHLFHVGRAFVFPCDAKGRVNLDSLSTRARNNYLFARALVGREVTVPTVECRELAATRVLGT